MKIIFSLLLILLSGSMVLSQTYIFQVRHPDSKSWGFSGLDGQLLFKTKFKYTSMFEEHGCAVVFHQNKYSIINMEGEVIVCDVDKLNPRINSWTSQPYPFSDGCLIISQFDKVGCINHKGKLIIPFKYDQITDFNGGYALARIKKDFFVLDKQGIEIPLNAEKIKEIKHFSEGLGIIEVKGGKWGFVDSSGQVAITPQFIGVGYFCGGLAWARTMDGNIGFINKKGEWVIKPQFHAAKSFDPVSGLAMVKANNQWGYVDNKGNFSIFKETAKTYIFSDGLAIGRKNGKVGFLNNTGQWAIQPKFNGVRPFKNGYAAAEIKDLWGIIDKEGNWIVQPTYEHIRDVSIVK